MHLQKQHLSNFGNFDFYSRCDPQYLYMGSDLVTKCSQCPLKACMHGISIDFTAQLR